MRYLVTNNGEVVQDVEAPNPEEAVIRALSDRFTEPTGERVQVYPLQTDEDGNRIVYAQSDLDL